MLQTKSASEETELSTRTHRSIGKHNAERSMALINRDSLPSFDDLKSKDPPMSIWGMFGNDDEVGMLNILGAEQVREAIALAKTGKVFSLDWALDQPNPKIARSNYKQEIIYPGTRYGRDDVLDRFYPQGSSQWDGLRHVRHPDYGFYNGTTDDDVDTPGRTKLGIHNWARRGIVGRGVFLDVYKHQQERGEPLSPGEETSITVQMLESTAKTQKVQFKFGDILLIRTGWVNWYESLSQDERQKLSEGQAARLPAAGLDPSEEMLRFIWEHHFPAMATDTWSFERSPFIRFRDCLHATMIPLWGMAIGEMWYLEELAGDCAADGVYEFLLTSAPLHIPGGIGSPPNALAIK